MSYDRRRFIQAFGAGSVGAVAGCSSFTGGDETETPTDSGDSGGEEGTPTPTESSSGDGTSGDTSGPTVITVEGGGADIWNQTDLGHFFYKTLTGDFDVRVQVTSVQNTHAHAKGGLMMRSSMNSGARHVFIRRRPGRGVSPQWRAVDGDVAASVTSDAGKEMARYNGGTVDGTWQRLERSGDTIRTYGSTDGEEWHLLAELPGSFIEFPDEVHVGLAVTSHNQAELCTAKFRNLEGLEPDTSEDIGAPLMPGNTTVDDNVMVAEAGEVSDAAPESATLKGSLVSLGGADSADVHFEYRQVPTEEWQSTDAQTVDSADSFTAEVSGLTARRYYEFRVVADNGEETTTSNAGLFSTPSGSSGSSSEGPRSASAIDPNDGFAEMAPWLDDDTPVIPVSSTDRAELKRAIKVDGPRVVAFETSGTIDLEAQTMEITHDKCWIAGQTAPSPGITMIRGDLSTAANDCVIQHVRVKSGDAGQEEGWEPDPIDTEDDTENNIIDHCTAMWSVDENCGTGYRSKNTTISNCLIAEPLEDSTHHKGPHGYTSLLGNNSKNVTYAGNAMAFTTDRNPRVKKGTEVAVVNNLIHYYSDGCWTDPQTKVSFEGNVYERPQTDQANLMGEGEAYAADNVANGVPKVGNNVNQVDSRPLWPENLEAMPSGDVRSHNLSNAGARPADRSAGDQRVIDNIRNGEGPGLVNSQEDVGGYPELEENTEELSAPESGLRAWLREQAVAVESTE